MTPVLRVEVEVDLAGHPVIVQFGEHGRHQPETGIRLRKDARHSGAPSEFPVDALQAVGGAQPHPVSRRKVEDCEGLGHGGLDPLSQLRVLLAPGLQGGFQEPLGLYSVRRIEDGAHPSSDRFLRLLAGDELTGILLHMKLAALPGTAGKTARRAALSPA